VSVEKSNALQNHNVKIMIHCTLTGKTVNIWYVDKEIGGQYCTNTTKQYIKTGGTTLRSERTLNYIF